METPPHPAPRYRGEAAEAAGTARGRLRAPTCSRAGQDRTRPDRTPPLLLRRRRRPPPALTHSPPPTGARTCRRAPQPPALLQPIGARRGATPPTHARKQNPDFKPLPPLNVSAGEELGGEGGVA